MTGQKGVMMAGTVKDVMTTNVVAVPETANYKDIVVSLRRWRVSACPVLDAASR
jgi:CBS domain-containing protein